MKSLNGMRDNLKFLWQFASAASSRPAETLDVLQKQNELLASIAKSLEVSSEAMIGKTEELLAATRWSNRISDVNRLATIAPIYSEINDVIESRQLSMLETVKTIAENRMSFARMGDGEFKLMLRPNYDIQFQHNSPKLASELRKILETPSEDLLLGTPQVFQDMFWSHMWADIWPQLSPIISERCGTLGNAHVTRPPFFSRYKNEAVQAWRSVWPNRDAVIVAGEGSRFDPAPELFDNLNKVSRIDSLAQHAYEDVERVAREVLSCGSDLALISLGPAGTVLASRLAKEGVQALDIGHLSASWESVFKGAPSPENR